MLDKGIMRNSSCLWDSIHPFGYLCKDVYVVHLVLEVVFVYELLRDHGYMDHYVLFYIHAII